MAARSLALGDGEIAHQARFRRQQVVAGVVELPVRQVETDREQVPIKLVQRPEIHRRREVLCTDGKLTQPAETLFHSRFGTG